MAMPRWAPKNVLAALLGAGLSTALLGMAMLSTGLATSTASAASSSTRGVMASTSRSVSRASSSASPYFPVPPQRLVDTRCAASPQPSFCAGEHLPSQNSGLTTLSAPGATGWSSPQPIDPDTEINSLSCPSAMFCMAMNFNNTVFTWNGSTWSAPITVNDPNGTGLAALSCASASSCVTLDNNGNVLTWNGSAWSAPRSIDPGGDGFTSVSCPSTTFCLAADVSGNVLTWNGSAWSAPVLVDPNGFVDSVSCPSTSFCMLSDAGGYAAAYNAGSWSAPALVDSKAGTLYVSCSSPSFCAAVDDYGRALTYDGSAWSAPVSIDPSTGFDSVSCPSASSCVAGDGLSDVLTWNGSGWSAPQAIDPNAGGIDSVSCPSTSFCAAGDFSGNVLVLHASAGHPTLDAQVAGVDGIPSGALDAVLNVTATGTTSGGYLAIYPAGGSPPAASSLNFQAGHSVANLVEVALSSSGQVSVTLGGSTGAADVILDVEGYVASAGSTSSGDSFVPIAPVRIADTRCFDPSYSGANTAYCKGIPDQVSPAGQVPPGGSVTIDVPNSFAGASAVVANLTVTDTTAPGYLTAYPAGTSVPPASNLNFAAEESVANRIEVPLASGAFSIYNGSSAPVDVVVDLNGSYTTGSGALFEGIAPARIVDTRCAASPPPSFCAGENLPAANASLGTLGPGATITVQVSGAPGFPAGASALVANLTAVGPQGPGYLTVFPAGSTRPVISDVNFAAGEPAVANMAVAAFGTNSSIEIYNGSRSTVNVLVDVAGYFVAAS